MWFSEPKEFVEFDVKNKVRFEGVVIKGQIPLNYYDCDETDIICTYCPFVYADPLLDAIVNDRGEVADYESHVDCEEFHAKSLFRVWENATLELS